MLEPAAHLAPQPETSQYKGQSQGSVKVLDFGLARAIWGPAGNQDLSQLAGLTAVDSVAGQIVGTPGYISREQAPGKYADKRAHIWAFGYVLYELLTGKRAARVRLYRTRFAACGTRARVAGLACENSGASPRTVGPVSLKGCGM